jgi:hypothetical protein
MGEGGSDPEAIYNLCLIKKKKKLCCNTALFAAAFTYIQIKLQVP